MVDGDAIAHIQLMIQDEALSELGIDLVEGKNLTLPPDAYDTFLDGPTSRRLGIVDFDPVTGASMPAPARFVPFDEKNPTHGSYTSPGLEQDPAGYTAINAYGTVFETIRMFEGKGGLGRQVSWAFDGDQLLIVPRAGEWANAFYGRDTRSLQFFWFKTSQGTIYTALSRDIVSHECGHALLDAVVPSLHDSWSPESIAIHEAIADLIAVLMAVGSDSLRPQVLERSKYSIRDATVFSSIAERFGSAKLDGGVPRAALRDLRNDNKMSSVRRTNAHELSTVLSALFYDFLIATYDNLFHRLTQEVPDAEAVNVTNAANRALGSAALIFRRVILRGTDYLPPGELGFADVGRATLAADRAGDPYPSPDREASRSAFAQRFVDREIVAHAHELEAERPDGLRVEPSVLQGIRDSDWAAYRFVEDRRTELGIPAATPFVVLPRIDATKDVRAPSETPASDAKSPKFQRELILKVAWDVLEPTSVGGVAATQRRLKAGATLVWRWEDGEILALLRVDPRRAGQGETRDQMLAELLKRRLVAVVTASTSAQAGLEAGQLSDGPDPEVVVEIIEGVARIRGTQRLLHLVSAW